MGVQVPSKGTEMVYCASAAPSRVMVAGTGGAPAGKAVERKGRRAVRAKRDVRECIVVGWVGLVLAEV